MAMADLSDDLDEFSDELSERFASAANHLQKLLPNVDSETLLVLYGFYKQGTEGPCNVPKPSWYDIRGKSKWEAWKKLGDMPSKEAKSKYIAVIEGLDQNFSSDSKQESKDSWVRVSTLQQDEEIKPDIDKNIFDYVKEGNLAEVKQLLNKNDLNTVDDDGLGLIHWASDRGSTGILEVLVENGADLELKDSDGQTALHYAVSCGHFDCVQFLLKKGCKPHVPDSDGTTPMNLAAEARIQELLASFV